MPDMVAVCEALRLRGPVWLRRRWCRWVQRLCRLGVVQQATYAAAFPWLGVLPNAPVPAADANDVMLMHRVRCTLWHNFGDNRVAVNPNSFFYNEDTLQIEGIPNSHNVEDEKFNTRAFTEEEFNEWMLAAQHRPRVMESRAQATVRLQTQLQKALKATAAGELKLSILRHVLRDFHPVWWSRDMGRFLDPIQCLRRGIRFDNDWATAAHPPLWTAAAVAGDIRVMHQFWEQSCKHNADSPARGYFGFMQSMYLHFPTMANVLPDHFFAGLINGPHLADEFIDHRNILVLQNAVGANPAFRPSNIDLLYFDPTLVRDSDRVTHLRAHAPPADQCDPDLLFQRALSVALIGVSDACTARVRQPNLQVPVRFYPRVTYAVTRTVAATTRLHGLLVRLAQGYQAGDGLHVMAYDFYHSMRWSLMYDSAQQQPRGVLPLLAHNEPEHHMGVIWYINQFYQPRAPMPNWIDLFELMYDGWDDAPAGGANHLKLEEDYEEWELPEDIHEHLRATRCGVFRHFVFPVYRMDHADANRAIIMHDNIQQPRQFEVSLEDTDRPLPLTIVPFMG